MIYAAGYGRRLWPITKNKPKALIYLREGLCLLEYDIRKLKRHGIKHVVINVHYCAQQIIEFVRSRDNFGIEVLISDEGDNLLDTGGGLYKAKEILQRVSYEGGGGGDILLYNADIVSNIDLSNLLNAHKGGVKADGRVATLAVQVGGEDIERGLLFNNCNELMGWQRACEDVEVLGAWDLRKRFSGIQVVSEEIFSYMESRGLTKYSIIELYLDIVRQGGIIKGYAHDKDYVLDVGLYENLYKAYEYIEEGEWG